MGIFGRRRRDRSAAAQEAPQDSPQDAPPRGTMRPAGPQDPPRPPGTEDGSWIYEVAGEYSSESWAPPESIRRWWKLDRDGNVIGEAVENEHFGPPKDDLTRATDPTGPLNWLPDPEETVRGWLTVALGRIADGLEVHWLKVTDTPVVLAGEDASDFAPPDFDRPPPARIGVAVPIGFGGQLPGYEPTVIWGLLLWVHISGSEEEDLVQNVWLRPEVEADRAAENLRIVLQAPDIRF
ncbi:hypothetical protein ACFCX4_35045 [Kitasatospora sp. NPDC056327]|uniref:hypothetical protein n=1 Tax=Kitasatospora sp. NPDC056327 TaxID=3345785 RepID=UPI0035E127E1